MSSVLRQKIDATIAAIKAEHAASAKLEDVEARLVEAQQDLDAKTTAVDETLAEYRRRIGADAVGESVDVTGAKKEHERAVRAMDDAVIVRDAVEAKRDEVEKDAERATRDAA